VLDKEIQPEREFVLERYRQEASGNDRGRERGRVGCPEDAGSRCVVRLSRALRRAGWHSLDHV